MRCPIRRGVIDRENAYCVHCDRHGAQTLATSGKRKSDGPSANCALEGDRKGPVYSDKVVPRRSRSMPQRAGHERSYQPFSAPVGA